MARSTESVSLPYAMITVSSCCIFHTSCQKTLHLYSFWNYCDQFVCHKFLVIVLAIFPDLWDFLFIHVDKFCRLIWLTKNSHRSLTYCWHLQNIIISNCSHAHAAHLVKTTITLSCMFIGKIKSWYGSTFDHRVWKIQLILFKDQKTVIWEQKTWSD